MYAFAYTLFPLDYKYSKKKHPMYCNEGQMVDIFNHLRNDQLSQILKHKRVKCNLFQILVTASMHVPVSWFIGLYRVYF